jgi:hypothetical protein
MSMGAGKIIPPLKGVLGERQVAVVTQPGNEISASVAVVFNDAWLCKTPSAAFAFLIPWSGSPTAAFSCGSTDTRTIRHHLQRRGGLEV